MLTKQDFDSAAKFIRAKYKWYDPVEPNSWRFGYIKGMEDLLIHLADSNPRFDQNRFLEACKPKPNPKEK